MGWLDEEIEEGSEGEAMAVKDIHEEDTVKKEMYEKVSDGGMQDVTMQDRDMSDSYDTVMADEEIRPTESRSYVCLPSSEPGRPGVIVVIMDDYGTVKDHIYYLA